VNHNVLRTSEICLHKVNKWDMDFSTKRNLHKCYFSLGPERVMHHLELDKFILVPKC